jgi:hypothetical protein
VLFDGQSKREVEGRSIEAFSVFKKGIRPEWEDPKNKYGGELVCRKSFSLDMLDQYWDNLVLALIGEIIDDSDEVCGCRVVDKSNKKAIYKLELWLKTGGTAEIADKIRTKMLNTLLPEDGSKTMNRTKMLDFEYKKRN